MLLKTSLEMVKEVVTIPVLSVSSFFEQPFGSLSKNTQSFALVPSFPFLPVGSLVTYNPTVFHLVPDDAPTAFTENFKLPAVSISAVLLLPADILLFAA